jgi:hypothetical protein
MNIFSSYETWINVPISQELRAALIDKGSEYAKTYYERWRQENIDTTLTNDNNVVDNIVKNVNDNNIVLAAKPDSIALHNKEL